MTVDDARAYWMSSRIPSDQYLLYCFRNPTDSGDSVATEVAARARRVDALTVKIRDVSGDFPWWVPMEVGSGHVTTRRLSTSTWVSCRNAIEELLTVPLDARESPWHLHLFEAVTDAPKCDDDSALVAVLQISHALADGRGTAHIARYLFGDDTVSAEVLAVDDFARLRRFDTVRRVLALVRRGAAAFRADRELTAEMGAGLVPASTPPVPLTRLNRKPNANRVIRTVTVPSAHLKAPGVSVTVGALTVISRALERYLSTGDSLVAETTFAKVGPSRSNNHFSNAGVDLHADVPDLTERARRIGRSVADRRARLSHRAFDVADRANAAVPARWIRSGVDHFDLDVVPETMTGTTVVSSVYRGPADLVLGGGTVVFTAGFPGLSPLMGLTHGVHGIGDVVTLSILTSPAVVDDVNRYERLLRDAVAEFESAVSD